MPMPVQSKGSSSVTQTTVARLAGHLNEQVSPVSHADAHAVQSRRGLQAEDRAAAWLEGVQQLPRHYVPQLHLPFAAPNHHLRALACVQEPHQLLG